MSFTEICNRAGIGPKQRILLVREFRKMNKETIKLTFEKEVK